MLISVNLWLKNIISHGLTHISLISDFHSIYGLGFGRNPFMAVCREGVVFRCLTVNVKNEDDEALLGFLESDIFKAGLGNNCESQRSPHSQEWQSL